MNKLVKALIAGTAIAALPLAAQAGNDGSNGSQGSDNSARILNGQVNTNSVWGNLNFEGNLVQNDVVLQGGAVGNTVSVMTMNDTYVNNAQQVKDAEISSTLNATLNLVGGSVGIANQTVCNAADISTDPQITAIDSKQECHGIDPSSLVNATVHNVVGNVSISGSAISNSFSADSNAPNMPVANTQINTAITSSTVNAKVGNVAGSVGASSMAVGNTAQIIHYSTGE